MGTPRFRARAFLCASCVAALCSFACNEFEDEPRELGVRSQPEIVDAVHNGGNAHFFFLPPLVEQPAVDGAFDAFRSPVVEICEWDGQSCALPLIATFTMATGPGSETVRLGAEAEAYIVNWHTDLFDLDEVSTYRISVLDGGVELGRADVDVVASGREIRNVDTDSFIALKDGRTLPIRFRVEVAHEIEVAAVSLTPLTSRLSPGDTVQLRAEVVDALGEPITGLDLDWASSDELVATVDESGLVAAVSSGRVSIRASNGASGEAMFLVDDPAADVVNVPGDEPTIQSAIDSEAPGDLIRLAPGTYSERIHLTRSVTLEGSAAAGVTIMPPIDNDFGPTIRLEPEVDVVVSGVRVVGIAESPAAIQADNREAPASLWLENVTVEGANRAIQGAFENIVVSGSTFINVWGNGLTLYDFRKAIFDNIVASEAQGACAYIQSSPGSHFECVGCNFDNCGHSGLAVVGSPSGDGYVKLSGSTFTNNGRSGLFLVDTHGVWLGPSNSVIGNAYAGVEAYNSIGTVVIHNTIADNQFFSLMQFDCSTMNVAHNSIVNSGAFAGCVTEFIGSSCGVDDPPIFYDLGGNNPCDSCIVLSCDGLEAVDPPSP